MALLLSCRITFWMSAIGTYVDHACECPLLGVKRTWRFALQMSAYDPKRTWTPAQPLPHYWSRLVRSHTTSGRGCMRRREFITLVGGAAAWPLAANAQQPGQMRRIGMLTGATTDDPESQTNIAVFLQVLQQLGWSDGHTVRIDTRSAGGNDDTTRQYAAELVALAPDVILSIGGAAVAQLLKVTRSVPIVFVNLVDPVGSGFVDSLSRPGGNATGFMSFEYSLSGKWLGTP